MTGALTLVLLLEMLGDRVKAPSFEKMLEELDWRAIFFYIALFALVGGLEKMHVLDALASHLRPVFAENFALGATLMYWITVPIVGIVEHDAYILTFLHTIKELEADGVPPWPLWWMLLWSGTLGSNLTVAGAPALYAALNICQREEKPQGLAARVSGLERALHPGGSGRVLRARHADLGPALRQVAQRFGRPPCTKTS